MIASYSILLSTLFGCSTSKFPSAEDIPVYTDEENEYISLPELDETITSLMVEHSVPGISACIIKSGEIVWCNGYGYANIETELEVTPNTPFMLASISKTIAGVALMHLIETGAIGLDDPINDHLLFDVGHPTDETEITARMLLAHTSGITDNWNVMSSLYVNGDSPITLSDFMEGYLTPQGQWYNADRNFVNGGVTARTVYSNIGASLAALLVEPVSGMSFSDYCHTHIFEPLEMDDTAWFISELNEDSVAVPYFNNGSEWEAIPHYGYPDYPDGALRTGAEPLAKFLLMFANGGVHEGVKILSESGVSEMKRVQYPNLDATQGLIWYSWGMDGSQVIGHNGGDEGVSTEMGFRNDGVGFVILMNGGGRNNTLSTIESALFESANNL